MGRGGIRKSCSIPESEMWITVGNKATRTVIHSLTIKVKSYLNEANVKKLRLEINLRLI